MHVLELGTICHFLTVDIHFQLRYELHVLIKEAHHDTLLSVDFIAVFSESLLDFETLDDSIFMFDFVPNLVGSFSLQPFFCPLR